MSKKHEFEGTISKTPETALMEHQKLRKVLNLSDAVERKHKENKNRDAEEELKLKEKEWETFDYYAVEECIICDNPVYPFFNFCPFCGAEFDDTIENINIHPGVYIQEIIENWGALKILEDTRLDEAILYDLLRGKQRITQDIAEKLEAGTHIDAQTWINLQNSYDNKK